MLNDMELNIKRPILSVLYAITIITLLFSCKAKETTVQTTQTSDTLITKSLSYKSEPIKTDYQIKLECDSLGNVKPIQLKETSGKNRTDLYIRDNILNAKLLTGLSQTKTDTIYISKDTKKDLDKKTVIYRTPFKIWLIIVAMGVIILLLLGVKLRF